LRPTVATGHPQLRVEAHILDFDGQLYGEELEVELDKKLREERKFASPQDLRAQIAKDLEQARAKA
jgi:riboflavin kinase/FMN adenylyltransferase